MFQPRKIASHPNWLSRDGIKIYTLSAHNEAVAQERYRTQLDRLTAQKSIPWHSTPAFVIFHDGATADYLVLAWWGNDNELFTSVSVRTDTGWVEDANRYSFCLWDLEIFWHERNFFIASVYCAQPDLSRYRVMRHIPAD